MVVLLSGWMVVHAGQAVQSTPSYHDHTFLLGRIAPLTLLSERRSASFYHICDGHYPSVLLNSLNIYAIYDHLGSCQSLHLPQPRSISTELTPAIPALVLEL
jgi:hypothetical protein